MVKFEEDGPNLKVLTPLNMVIGYAISEKNWKGALRDSPKVGDLIWSKNLIE